MERLGKPRHRREDQRLSELEVSESNLSMMLLFVCASRTMADRLCGIANSTAKCRQKYDYAA